jgi:hypothetical protein
VGSDSFRRSSFCTDAHGCVEVAVDSVEVRLRDAKHPDGPALVFDRPEWQAFLAGVKAGEFDA